MKPYVSISGYLVPPGDCCCPQHHEYQDCILIDVWGLSRLKNNMSCIVLTTKVQGARKGGKNKDLYVPYNA